MTSVDYSSSIEILTIPPCKDSVGKQNNVELTHACIISMAEKMKIKVTNNDMSFKLDDRSVNDGYLHVDGLHLCKWGTKKASDKYKSHFERHAKGDLTRNKTKKKPVKNTERFEEIPEATKHTGSSNGTTDDWSKGNDQRGQLANKRGNSVRPNEHFLLHGIQKTHKCRQISLMQEH
ncbi:hypothetical protein CAPTEDRAFT_215200 [Capitella teleta]|uniref:Uncharacterized protein n=1 Tax=Capitella teleta TaxID=283909 RepID=R7TMY1_CAPTE|nr:hypothetical protein CAPTEDRAFT_215200 [Capitella teleta]|eukprot:ELT94999.1 hypothetical protein CAPTEDRAFT_215200 [Capitella teleta]